MHCHHQQQRLQQHWHRHRHRQRQRAPTTSCSCASLQGAQQRASAPSVTCRTIVSVSGPDDLQAVLLGNDLVAEVFYDTSSNPLLDAVQFNSYRLRSAAQTLGLHMGPSRAHATIVALSSSGAAADGSRRQQQPSLEQWRLLQEEPQKAVGVVNVSLMQASPSIATAAAVRPGTPFAMLTNMAVRPEARRRGVAHALMEAAVKAAVVDLDLAPPFALLLAYKYYEPAMRLYESWGFAPTPWVDPAWKEDAEKGRPVGRQRRVMMVKQLSGPGLLARGGGSGGSGGGSSGGGGAPPGGSSL